MTELKINVPRMVTEEVAFSVPAFRKFTSDGDLDRIDRYRVGKVFKTPDNRSGWDTVVYMKVDLEKTTFMKVKKNTATKSVIYEVERGDNPPNEVLHQLLAMSRQEIDSNEFDAVLVNAGKLCDGTLSDDDLFPVEETPSEDDTSTTEETE